MQRVIAAFAMGLALAGAVGGVARCGPEADTGKELIDDPDWLTMPTSEDRAKAFPPEAVKKGVGGHTTMHCKVQPDGRLTDCAVTSEAPAGFGFGAASLSIADRFRMKPQAVEARRAGGQAAVDIPIHWSFVTNPDWKSQPSGEDLSSLFPTRAIERHLNGKTQVECRVKADGTLEGCAILFEAPEGLGFGEATLKATRRFRMNPLTMDGQPAAGGVVTIPMNWIVPGGANGVFRIGDEAMLVTVLKPGAKPQEGKENVFACPSATDKARRCWGHKLDWAAYPTNAQAWAAIERNRVGDGKTMLNCAAGDDGALRECVVVGKASAGEEAAMRELAADLRLGPETLDGLDVKVGRVMMRFDWQDLKQATRPAR